MDSWDGEPMTGTTVSMDTLRDWLDQGRPVTVLDVRPSEQYAEWAIPGSIHVDAYRALKAGDPNALSGLRLRQDRPVITVCGQGHTAAIVTRQLRDWGYDALTLGGGMKAWSLAWNTAEVQLMDNPAFVIQVRRTGKGCLSYLIGSGRQAAVIDASLAPEVYVRIAKKIGCEISAVLDTHIHADHLSRSRRLAERTGATLYLPHQQRVLHAFQSMRDTETIEIGRAKLQALHTPGHTSESNCYLLDGEALFTGDTLFLAGVGRPDLEATPEGARTRARQLYVSLQKILSLPVDVLVLPGHMNHPAPFDGIACFAPLALVVLQPEKQHGNHGGQLI